jgi:hypothetical protein
VTSPSSPTTRRSAPRSSTCPKGARAPGGVADGRLRLPRGARDARGDPRLHVRCDVRQCDQPHGRGGGAGCTGFCVCPDGGTTTGGVGDVGGLGGCGGVSGAFGVTGGSAAFANAATSGSFTSGGVNFSNRLSFFSVFGFATTRQWNAVPLVPPCNSCTANPVALNAVAYTPFTRVHHGGEVRVEPDLCLVAGQRSLAEVLNLGLGGFHAVQQPITPVRVLDSPVLVRRIEHHEGAVDVDRAAERRR